MPGRVWLLAEPIVMDIQREAGSFASFLLKTVDCHIFSIKAADQ